MAISEENRTEVDDYIQTFPEDVQKILYHIRSIIKEEAPEAQEKMSYSMATYILNGFILVHFAGFKHHVGFYPTSTTITHFKDKIQGYKYSKNTIQFPFQQPIPYDLIREIIRYRVEQNAKSTEGEEME